MFFSPYAAGTARLDAWFESRRFEPLHMALFGTLEIPNPDDLVLVRFLQPLMYRACN